MTSGNQVTGDGNRTRGPDDLRRRLWSNPWAPPAILLGLAAALFVPGLATHPIGRDEAVSVLAARHSPPDLVNLIVNHEPHPAGYYLALSLWPHATLVQARLFSLLPALLCVVVIFLCARRLSLPAWPAGVLAATSPFLGFYSVEARMYSWLAFAGALTLLFTVTISRTERPAPGWAVAAGGALAVAGYVHYFAVFLGLAVMVELLIGRRARQALAVLATATFLYLPGLVLLAAQIPVLRRYPAGTWQAKEDPAHVFQAFSVLLAGAESHPPAFAATTVLLAVIIFALVRLRSLPAVRTLGTWLLPTIVLPLAIGALVPLDSPRYLAAAVPALVLLLAAATASLRPARALALAGVVAALGGALVIDSYHREDTTKPPVPSALALAGPDRLVVAQHLLLAPELAFYREGPLAYDFGAPRIDRIGYWALPPGARYPPAKPLPLLIVNYCGRLLPPPPGYTVSRKVRLEMNLCAELVEPPTG